AGAQGTTTTRFAYDGGDVWADLDGNNAVQVRRVYGDGADQPLAKVASGAATFYLADRLGSVRDLMNSSGTVLGHLDYDGFGKVTAETAPGSGDRLGYAGGERDAETGLDRF